MRTIINTINITTAAVTTLLCLMVALSSCNDIITIGADPNDPNRQAICHTAAEYACQDIQNNWKYFKCCASKMEDCMHSQPLIRKFQTEVNCHYETHYEPFCYGDYCVNVAFDIEYCEA